MEKEERSDIITDMKSIEANEIIKELEERNEQLRIEIKERIKAQNSMRQGEKFLQLIISSIDETFIYIIDDQGMINFAWAPESLEENYGLKFQEHLGRNFGELIQDLIHEDNIILTSDLLKIKRPRRREFLIKTPNGKKWIDTTFSPLIDKKNFINGTVVASRDITEIKNIEKKLKIGERSLQELNEKLEQRIVEKTNELQDTNRKLQQEINGHKQTEIELQRRLDFEKTIAEISSRFLRDQDFEKSIDFTLELIGNFSDASRAYVFQFDDNLTTMTNTHEWCNVGVSPAKPDHDHAEMLTKETPWWMEQLLKGNVILLKSLSELPEDAVSTRKALERHDIKSILTIPIEIKSKLKGFIGFDDVKNTDAWKEEDIRILKVAAEIISYALSKNYY